ncbi:MAG: T9SS type A sorting domain-containing protein [Ignavibacteriae bacterium]|nr:T9SS type A sorting domain-containing protein [Ignavibacteriota bacterium]
MKNFIQYCLFLVIAVIAFLTIEQTNSIGQQDPNRDYPVYIRPVLAPSLYSPGAVVTIDDYDNWQIGTDFAEVGLAGNPLNPTNFSAAWNNLSTAYGAYLYYTLNGIDWFASSQPVWTSMWGDPVVTSDGLGNFYFDNMYGVGSSPTNTKVAKSTNGGQTWPSVVTAGTGNDKNWIAAVQTGGPYANYIFQVMTPGNIKRSTDLGATFTQVASYSNTLPGAMVCIGPNGATNGGAVYVVTHTGSSTAATYNFYCSTDGGTTWVLKSSQYFAGYIGTQVSSRHSVQNMRTRPYPFIIADNSNGPYRGRLYLTYARNTPNLNGSKPDIFSRYSTDFGTTWSDSTRVNDDPGTNNNNQWFPSTWCDINTGKLYIKWLDTRDCPTSDSCMVYGTVSTDGGVTFAVNQKISNKKFRINCTSCNGGSPAYLGDYDYLASNGKVAMVAWTDFRNNSFGNYVGYFPDFAMRMNPTSETINSANGVKDFSMIVPSVKLYTDTVIVSAVITPTPGSGTLVITYPSPGGNILTSLPGQLSVRVTAANVTPGTYTMTVTAKGPNGTPVHQRAVTIITSTTSSVTNEGEAITYKLEQNYPNPFNPVTKINYSIAKISDVKISVYNTLGKEVASFENQKQSPGNHFIIFNANSLSTGIYYYKIQAGGFTDVKKMMLVK